MTLEHHPSRRWLWPVTVLGLFVVALTAWTFYLTQAELAVFNDSEGNAMQKWTTWLGVPLACVLTIMLAHWNLSATAAAPAERQRTAQRRRRQQPAQRSRPSHIHRPVAESHLQ